jgi:hypothetical protein
VTMTTRKSHKQRGATFETDLRNYFRANGYNAERLARTGARDEGDIVISSDFLGSIGVVEAKAPGASNRIDLSGWTKEAQLEAKHYAESRGLGLDSVLPALVIKARGKAIADAYLVFRLGDIFGE